MSHPSSSSSSSSSKHNLPPPASTSVSASPSSTDLYLPDPPRDLISSIVFTPTATTDINTDPIDVLISSWDHHVHHYRIHPTSLKSASTSIYDALHKQQTFAHQAPVLDVCFITSHLAASACVDRRVRLLDLATGKTLILGKHDDSVLKLRYCPQTNLLISGSADRTLKIWNVALNHSDASIDISGFSNNGLLKTLQMPDKVIAMDISPPYSCFNNASEPTLIYSASTPGKATPRDSTPRLVVAMAARHVYVYDLLPLKTTIQKEAQGQEVKARDWQPDQKRESSLKFMARDLRCMPAGDGYVMSSVEGRVAVEFFDPSAKIQAGKYAFKCHRHTVTTTHPQREQDDMVQDNDHGRDDLEMPYDIVYPVHAVAFHPTHGTFASLGGDGVVSIWDAGAKKRIRQYTKLFHPTFTNSSGSSSSSSSTAIVAVTAGAFDGQGKLLLIATGNDVKEKEESHSNTVQLILKTCVWEECKPKLKSSTTTGSSSSSASTSKKKNPPSQLEKFHNLG